MKLKVLFVLALAFCLSGFVFGQEVPVTPETQRGYLIGPGDVISVKVLGEKDFDIDAATVDEDGKIEVPFSDTPVIASCKTEKELRAEVTKVLSKYLRNPQISLRVSERKSRPPATIYGEVRQQQQIVLTRKARLLELLSFAGGVTKEAGGMIQVFRTQPPVCSDGSEEMKWVSGSKDGTDVPSRMYSLTSVKQGREEANPEILPGDIIVVQKASPIYVIGEVMALKEIPLTENGLSLTEAIAQAGGFNREAKTKDITIRRLKSNSRERDIIIVNYDLVKKGKQQDVMLEPEDIVIVNKTKKGVAETILDIVTGGAKNAATILPTVVL